MTTPVSRRALLLGHMVADFVLVVALSVPVMILGFFMVPASTPVRSGCSCSC